MDFTYRYLRQPDWVHPSRVLFLATTSSYPQNAIIMNGEKVEPESPQPIPSPLPEMTKPPAAEAQPELEDILGQPTDVTRRLEGLERQLTEARRQLDRVEGQLTEARRQLEGVERRLEELGTRRHSSWRSRFHWSNICN